MMRSDPKKDKNENSCHVFRIHKKKKRKKKRLYKKRKC